jgi:sugar/nucleoside kinase (ribokinase family)
MGALHVCCDSSDTVTEEGSADYHEVTASSSAHPKMVEVNQHIVEGDLSTTWKAHYSYKVHHAGVITDAHIVDTTGAGDAFIGGYILAQLLSTAHDYPMFGLEFGSWVGGKKLSGPGARSALPRGCEVDAQLGRTPGEVQGRLGKLLRPFAHAENIQKN